MVVRGRTLQKLRDSVLYFARQRLIRYGAGQRHGSNKRTESQDRSRSCRTLILAWQQTDNQLKIRLDLIRGKRTSPLVAASDFRGQCAEGTARTWILTVHIAQVVVDKFLEGERLSGGFSSFLLALPSAECI